MRYDTPIYFQIDQKPTYDEETGDYKQLEPDEVRVQAAVMDTSEEKLKLYYGVIPQGTKTIHIQNHFDILFNHIRIGDKVYDVDFERRLRTKHTFIVHEVT